MSKKKVESKSIKTAKIGEKFNNVNKIDLDSLSKKILGSEKSKDDLDSLVNNILKNKETFDNKDDGLNDLAAKILASKGDIDDDIDDDIDKDSNEIIIEEYNEIDDNPVLGEELIDLFDDLFDDIKDVVEKDGDISDDEGDNIIEIIDDEGDNIEIEYPTKEYLNDEIEKIERNLEYFESIEEMDDVGISSGEDDGEESEDDDEESGITYDDNDDDDEVIENIVSESVNETDNEKFIVDKFVYQSKSITDNGTYELFEKNDKIHTTRKYIKIEKLTKFIIHIPKIIPNYDYYLSVTDEPFNIYFNGSLLLDFYIANSSVDFTIDGLLFNGKLFPYDNLEFIKL